VSEGCKVLIKVLVSNALLDIIGDLVDVDLLEPSWHVGIYLVVLSHGVRCSTIEGDRRGKHISIG